MAKATQPIQVTTPAPLITTKSPIPSSKFTAPNPVFGSGENLVNALLRAFPQTALKAGGIVAAKFYQNLLANPNYTPDEPENFDTNIMWGNLLNTPQYGSLEFGNTDTQNQSGNQYTGIDGKTYVFDNMVLPIALITVTQPTNIIKTKITGRPGAIKEYIGADDKMITINAVVNMPNDQAPVQFLHGLQQMKDAAVTIPVTNYFLNALNINYVVIEDISTPQEEGGYSNISFTITACSDIPLANFLP